MCKPPSCNIYPISLEQYEALYILVSRVIRGRLRHLLDQAGGLCASPHGQPWGSSHKSLRPQWEENIPAQSSRFRLQQHISCFSTYPKSPPACKSVPNPPPPPPLPLPVCGPGGPTTNAITSLPQVEKKTFHSKQISSSEFPLPWKLQVLCPWLCKCCCCGS